METFSAAVVLPNAPPPPGTNLVVFADAKPYVSEVLSRPALAAAARYARRYGVYLVPERFLADNSLCLCLLSPDGEPVAAQKATHLSMDYREYRLRREREVLPFDTPFGKTALLVDADGCMPHVARQAVQAGASFLLMSQFIQPYDSLDDRICLGAQNAARSNGVPVVASIGSCGVICRPDGETIASPFEEAPIGGPVTPQAVPSALSAGMREAKAVLFAHRGDILSTGGMPDA